MKDNAFVQKMMRKWNVSSVWDFLAIMIVFSLAGMSIVFVRKPLFVLLGITKETPFFIKFFTWLIIVFPTYQLGLLVFGFLLGQFKFFWEKEKQLGRMIKRLFTRKPAA